MTQAARKQAETPQRTPHLTPMMAQYMSVKEAYPDCLLFYRMGDFYELFFDDATTAAGILDIALTKRNSKGDDVPMCGVPWHSHETYLAKLIRAGHKVAICEQTETPEQAKKRGGSKALVNREVIRVITQGTLTEDSLLDTRTHNYLAAVADVGGNMGLSWLDLSTGEFWLQPVSLKDLPSALERIGAGEVLIPEKLQQKDELFELWAEYKRKLTPQANSRFDSENARKRLETFFGVGTLESFGGFGRGEIAAAGALLDYVELTQKGKLPHLSPPKQLALGAVMEIDAATRRNLELMITLNGQRKGSLLSTIDKTITGSGARLLASYLSAPLTEPETINTRLDMVDFFVARNPVRDDVRTHLKSCPDIERALARLSLERGGPRDLAAIRDGLSIAGDMVRNLRALNDLPHGVISALDDMKETVERSALLDRLTRALAPDLPVLTRDGGFIAQGYAPQLDELRGMSKESRRLIANLQSDYAGKTGITSLKIKHNNVLGFHIDVTALHGDKLLNNESGEFIHRQTLANSVRFTTVELSDLERKISEAGDRALAIELELFEQLASETNILASQIARVADGLAQLDVAMALAELAVQKNYSRPKVDNSLAFDIKGGRHPVVETALKSENTEFIANDCDLSEGQRLWLLTGPNMAGKSTFLRQNALIALLAQMGSYVPAEAAHIGVIDRLFSRVGASDDLARGRSTFMVEMVETATILNQATERSLVILDEIGRGTATFDGLSIAWACVENLHDVNQSRALFATHYHELTSLTSKLSHLTCHTMKIKEWDGKIIFMHEVAQGTSDRSYGIHVAELAGLPPAVIARATQILEMLEQGEQSGALAKLADDLPLFSNVQTKEKSTPSALETHLAKIDPDALSPKEALEAVYALKKLYKP